MCTESYRNILFVWFLSLSMIMLRISHVGVCINAFFLLLVEAIQTHAMIYLPSLLLLSIWVVFSFRL